MSDKRAALKKIVGRLAKLIPLLASDMPGEVFSTARVITRVLASVKLDLHDLVTFMAGEKATPLADLVGSPKPNRIGPKNMSVPLPKKHHAAVPSAGR